MFITIIVPCYNEEAVIEATHTRLSSVCEEQTWDVEYLYINDGSCDQTEQLLDTLAMQDSSVRVLKFSRNFGHQAAVCAGLDHAHGDAAVIIDADLQDPPELIPTMVDMWQKGEGRIIYGKRTSRDGETWFKKWSAGAFYRLIDYLSDTPLPRDTGDFRLVDRKVIEAFKKLPERNKYIRGLFPWLGFKAVPLEYHRDARLAGETKYPLAKMLRLAFNGIFSFSRKPLQMATNLGVFNLVASLLLMVYVFVSYFSKQIESVPGWASTMLVLVFFSGIQLVSLGLLGAYVGRIFEEVKGRPEYVVEEEISCKRVNQIPNTVTLQKSSHQATEQQKLKA